MIAIVHSIYSRSVHAPALDAVLMDNDAERYCMFGILLTGIIIQNYMLCHIGINDRPHEM